MQFIEQAERVKNLRSLRKMGHFQNTCKILHELNISWENLLKQIQLKIYDLKIEGSEGNHSVLKFGGSGVHFQGHFLAFDYMITC